MEIEINAPVIETTSIFAEVELFKDWAPITPESLKLKEVTPMRKLVYLRNNLTFPFKNREIIFEGSGFFSKQD